MFGRWSRILPLAGFAAAVAHCPGQATQPAQSSTSQGIAGKPPPARIGHVAEAVGGNLYVFGGLANDVREDGGQSGWRYDVTGKRWTTIAPMQAPRTFAASAVLDERIVVMGGIPAGSRAYVATVEVYDPRRDAWERLTDMPIARSRFGAATIAGKLYAVSGLEGSDERCRTGVRLDEFDPKSGKWMRKRDIPHGRHAFAAVAFHNRLYVLGGYLDNRGQMTPTNLVESYDPKTDSWRAEPPMNCTRTWFAAVVCEDGIIALGGLPDGPPGPERLAVGDLKWQVLPQSDFPGRRFAAVVIRDEILVTGGEGVTGGFVQIVRPARAPRP